MPFTDKTRAIAEVGTRSKNLVRFAWGVLAYNVGVILWGAYVRATGSGAGCGNHWPLCNGEVIPSDASVQMMIEFTHRFTSGLALVSVVVLWWWTRRSTPKRHLARYGALAALILMVNEALLGASLVLFQHVAQDKSVARAVSLSLHFVNTLLLLAAITLTAYCLSSAVFESIRPGRKRTVLTVAGLVAVLLAGATGALAALGDTLFPASSLASSLQQDFSSTSFYLLRLRMLHPVTAIMAAVFLFWLIGRNFLSEEIGLRRLSILVLTLISIQVGLGFLNVVLLAPVWLQMVHLLFADLMWISLVLLSWRSLSLQQKVAEPAIAGRA